MRTLLPNWFTRAGRLLLAGLLLPLAARAQAPANDDPTGAVRLTLAATCTPTSATNAGATTTAPNGYANPGCGIATAPKDVWFRFTTDVTGPGSTAVAIAVTSTIAGQVRVFSSTGGAAGPFTAVGCASGGSNNSQAPRLVVAGLTPATIYYVSVSGYGSTDTQGLFSICATVPVANDAAVEAVLTLTQLPIPPGVPHIVKAVVSNQGSTARTNLPVTLTVTGANAFTNIQTVPTLAPGASATVSFATFTPTTAITNDLTVTIPADDDNTNNSRSVTQVVNTTTYSYADPGGATGAFQYGSGNTDRAFSCRYRVNSPASVTQVRSYVVNGTGLAAGQPGSSIGKTVYGVLVDLTTGTLLARSADYVLTAADINTYVALPLTTQVALPAGTDVLVGMVSVYPTGQTVTYAPYGTQVDGPGRTDAFYDVSTVSAFAPVIISGNTGGYKRLMIEAVMAPATACPAPTNLTATAATPTGATLAFTPPTGGSGPYPLTYFASGVPATTVAATASPATLSGLVPGTTYTVGISASCGSGQVSYPTFITFTTPLSALAQDAAVAAVQTLTRLPIPAGTPHVVRAVVTNRGTQPLTNLPVTLTVTGANAFTNTQTLATLAVGASATVSFAGFTPTAAGTNTLAVTVPADNDNTNNSRSATQMVNTTTFSYDNPGGALPVDAGFGPTNVENAAVVRFQTSTLLRVTQVRVYLRSSVAAPAPAATEGKTMFGVLLNAAGVVLARSPDYVVAAGDLNTYVTFTLTNPPTLPVGSSFYAGAAQTYQPGQTVEYDPFGVQATGPGQPNTFYAASTTQPVVPTDLASVGQLIKPMVEAVTQVVTATRSEALAATVGLYPNPAHGSFALAVPAGPLGAASATLRNALGQVVQTQRLRLPAAGGTTEFDVRGLAAGIYTLQLQTGETLVVKRVVLE